jgi:TetR/AcrR family tetracycline transcriptional repressor
MSLKQTAEETRRAPLSAERIINTALRLADAEGLDALSMRRVAAELDASPMALYNHVPNKDALLDGLAAQLLMEMDLKDIDTSDPAPALRAGYAEFRRVLLLHPNLISVLERRINLSVDAMRPIELALSLLGDLGFSPEEALQAHWALSGFTMGHVVWQKTSPLFDEDQAEHALDHKRMLPADEFPCLHAALPWLEVCDMDSAFEFGIDCMIKGFDARIAAGKN